LPIAAGAGFSGNIGFPVKLKLRIDMAFKPIQPAQKTVVVVNHSIPKKHRAGRGYISGGNRVHKIRKKTGSIFITACF
jgi:hypothetical protein